MSLLLRLLDVAEPVAPGLHGRPVRERRRGKVGRLDAEWREELRQAEEARTLAAADLAAQQKASEAARSYITRALAKQAEDEAARLYARIAAQITELRARIDAEAAQFAQAEAERIAAHAAYVEALRIAEDRDDEDALEALLFAN